MKDICFGYFKISTDKGTGHICIAVSTIPNEIKVDGVRKYYEYICSFSLCSPKDRFEKRLARDKASGRLRQFQSRDIQSPFDVRVWTLTKLENGRDLHNIMKDAVTSSSFINNAPAQWFKRAVKRDSVFVAGLKETAPKFVPSKGGFLKASIVTSAVASKQQLASQAINA